MKYKALLAFTALSTLSFSAEYIIPPSFDNLRISHDSAVDVLITNTSGYWSGKTYTIGDKSGLKIRCQRVPAISCRNGKTAKMVVKIKEEPNIREPKNNEALPIYDNVVASESHSGYFSVCGGAMGGMQWDDTNFNQSGNTFTFSYTPLKNSFKYYPFTNVSGNTSSKVGDKTVDGGSSRGSNSSKMVIHAVQYCK